MVTAQLAFPDRLDVARRGSEASSCGLLMLSHAESAPEGPAHEQDTTSL